MRRGDGSWLVDGLIAEELKESLGLKALPDEQEGDYQTVGEMVIAHLGHVPAAVTASSGRGSPSRSWTWTTTASTRCS